jgi:hypothetical protein
MAPSILPRISGCWTPMRPVCRTPIRFRAIVMSRNRAGPRKQMGWLANGLQMILRMSFTDVWRKQFLPLSRRFRHECAGSIVGPCNFGFVVVHFRFFGSLHMVSASSTESRPGRSRAEPRFALTCVRSSLLRGSLPAYPTPSAEDRFVALPARS